MHQQAFCGVLCPFSLNFDASATECLRVHVQTTSAARRKWLFMVDVGFKS